MSTKLYAISLFLAPSCYALSTFFWQTDGQYTQYSVTAGSLLIVGSVFWVIAFAALFDKLKDKTPNYASWGLLVAVYGCLCGGVSFALRDVIALTFNISHPDILHAFAKHPIFDNVVFWIGGPAFPISLLLVGIVLAWTKTTAPWVGIMIALSGVLFPVSRIFRIELVGHTVDVLMLVPMVYLSWQMSTKNQHTLHSFETKA
jgi:hypothetical protein